MYRVPPGTEGYTEHAAELIERYEAIDFAEKHRSILHLLPIQPSRVLDIGAGTGADAAWLARRGHCVVAVEPVRELYLPGMTLQASPRIEWVDDALPALDVVLSRKCTFDLIMLNAVWMHLDEPERRAAMPNVVTLLGTGGLLLLSLRHGPLPPKRRMFDVSAEETIDLARRNGLHLVFSAHTASTQARNRTAGVTWSRLAFSRAA